MSEFSFPFTENTVGDDGPYSASFFTDIYTGTFRQDDRADASVLYGTGNGVDAALLVAETSPASNSVEIKSGKALVQGYFYWNDSDLAIPIAANNDGSGFDRIDTVVLEIDFIANTVRANVVEGTASGSPVAPTLTKTSALYQVPLANIAVANLFTTIVNADINNAVREQGILWHPNQGGTGIEGGYTDYDLIGANSSGELEIITNGGDFHIPVGDSTQSGDYGLIDRRQIVLWRFDDTSFQSLSTSTVIELTDSHDDTGYLLQLSSNQFRLALGTYRLLNGGLYVFNSTGTSTNLSFSLQNNDTGAILSPSADVNINEVVGNAAQFMPIIGLEFEVTDITHDYEFVVDIGAAGLRLQADGGTYSNTYPEISASAWFMIERIQ